tara:strand:+ start:544 stop:1299 length:756 start_codon:yes stop_codon:yes gene_type:complete
MPLPALALAGGALMGLGGISHASNRPRTMNHNFRFDLQSTDYSANPNMLASIQNLNQTGAQLGAMGNQFNQQYQNMIDPNSAYNRDQIAQASTAIGDTAQARMNAQQGAIASTGGPKNLSGLLGAVGRNQDAEQLLKASQGIRQQSVNQAGQFGQMATGALGQQGNMYAQAGGLGSQMDARQLQNDQFNAQNQNQYNQYLRTSAYNQAVGNMDRQQAHRQGWTDMFSGLGGSLLGMSGIGIPRPAGTGGQR